MTTLKEVDELERQVKLLFFIEKNLKEIKITSMTRAQWIDNLLQKFYPPTRPAGYVARPQKVTPLNRPFEVKTHEQEQAELERRWLAERRRKGYIEL